MVDHPQQLEKWLQSGKKLAIARVVSTWRSSPRPAGASLIVTEDGEMMGSVSGGCVENAVVKQALKVMESGESILAQYGVQNEDAWEVGLSCGGKLSIFIQPFFDKSLWTNIKNVGSQKQGRYLLTKLDQSGTNQLIDPTHDHSMEEMREQSAELYRLGKNQIIEVQGQQYFHQSFRPKPKMLLIGSAHISAELTHLAHLYGFDTVLVDPRDTFAKKTHYESKPGEVHVQWPQEVLPDMQLDSDTYVVILSHDPKIDDEALKIILRSPVKYIGALGSKKTHAKRVGRLNDYGFTDSEIGRIEAPIGISINSHSASEIALSIMAQLIKYKNI